MRIYELINDLENYDYCKYAGYYKDGVFENRIEFIRLDGTRQGLNWYPRVMKRANEKPVGDNISCLSPGFIILSRHALTPLSPLLGNIEELSLMCDFGDYVVINVLDVLDCVDYDSSKFIRFSQQDPNILPRIMRFEEYAFFPERIGNHHIFKIPDESNTHIFVDDVFFNAVKEHNITGFDFIQVWTDEKSEFADETSINKEPLPNTMGDEDFACIEQALNITLPETYKSALRENRLAQCGLPLAILSDPQAVIEVNQRLRLKGIRGTLLKPEHFVCCYDKRDRVYRFLDLSNPDSPLYMFEDTRKGKYSPDNLARNKEYDSLEHFINMYCMMTRIFKMK